MLMGLAQLNCSELRLKRLSHRYGLLGYDKLLAYLASEWLQDIKKNQLPGLLSGVGPMYSVVQLCEYTGEARVIHSQPHFTNVWLRSSRDT